MEQSVCMRVIPLIAASLLILLASTPKQAIAAPPSPIRPLPRVDVTLKGYRFVAEAATTNDSRAYGLMNRSRLDSHRAMLFVFRHAAPRWFWMKDTKIALDMLFFDAQRKLVSMQLDATPCTSDPCAIYPSDKPAKYVLEIAAGVARQIGVRPGSQLRIKGDYGEVQ